MNEQKTNATLDKLNASQKHDFWVAEIGRGKKYFSDYWALCDQIYERYKDERALATGINRRTADGGKVKTKRFNILWSIIQTLFPALYSSPPEPMVGRRYKDEDPLARLSSELMERCLSYIEDPDLEQCSFDSAARNAVLDYLLISRGVIWPRYEKVEVEEREDVFTEDADGGELVSERVVRTELESEHVFSDHLGYRHFLHQPAPTWDMVLKRGWAGRLHFLTKPEVAEQFGEAVAEKVQLTASDQSMSTNKASQSNSTGDDKDEQYAEVWEIWNVPDRKVYYISEGMSEPLDVQDDPLDLRDFLPCKRPIYGTLTPDSLIPVPDYVQYYDQAENLDLITDKKWKLTTALRVVGMYAGNEAQTIQQMFDGSGGNKMIPVTDWAQMENGGVANLVAWLPIDLVVQAIRELQGQEEANKQQIYEITGVADIVRGQSKASETLGAQRIKGQWASVRISDRQGLVADGLRDVLRVISEIVCAKFDERTIGQMTNFANSSMAQDQNALQAFQAAIGLLRDDKMRTFRTDVETRDTVFADEMQERQQNVEMLTGISQFIDASADIGAKFPEATPVLGEMLKIAMSSFSGSKARQLEVKVDEMIANTQDRLKKEQENPQPSPEQLEAQAQQQKDQTVAQQGQATLQIKAQGQVLDFKDKMAKNALEKRGQDLQYQTQDKDRLASLLAKAAGGGGAS